MKKKFLVLSAMLTLVVSGVCLQSCSSEFDSYTTEEYGYYTEEEINAIEALAEKYGVNIDVDKDYYGEKLSLDKFENEFKSLQTIVGEYEMTPIKDGEGKTTFIGRKKGEDLERSLTRASEKGSWSGKNKNYSRYDVSVTVSWDLSKKFRYEILKAEATIVTGTYNTPDIITSNFIGSNIEFYGSVSGRIGYGADISVTVVDGIVFNYPNGGSDGIFYVE